MDITSRDFTFLQRTQDYAGICIATRSCLKDGRVRKGNDPISAGAEMMG